MSQSAENQFTTEIVSAETAHDSNVQCLELIDFASDAKVLVLGSLDNSSKQSIQKKVGPNGSVTLAESNRRKFARDFKAETLKWDDESFDLVYCHFSLSFSKNPQQSLAELIRVVKPKGKVIVADHDAKDFNHYPLAPYLEKNLMELLQETARLKIWDAQMGRKLYSLFFESGLKDVQAQVLPHRVICGQTNAQEIEEWTLRLEEISALNAKGSLPLSFDLDSFRSEFFAFFQNPTRFSYSSVILVEGIKDG